MGCIARCYLRCFVMALIAGGREVIAGKMARVHWRRDSSWADRGRWAAASVIGDALGQWALDVTNSSGPRSCLVIAPHPDDETLACGATLARKVEMGTPVRVLVVTDGSRWPPDRDADENAATRHAELRRACSVLGIDEDTVTHLLLPETRLHAELDGVTDVIADAVRQMSPDDVFTTSPADPHADHAAIGLATRRAVGRSPARLLEYGVWQWEHPRSWIRTMQTSKRPEAVATTGFLEKKRAALSEYRSQLAMSGLEDDEHTMSRLLLHHFLGRREIFFPVRLGSDSGA